MGVLLNAHLLSPHSYCRQGWCMWCVRVENSHLDSSEFRPADASLGGGSSSRSPLSSPWTVQAQCAKGAPCPDDTAYRGCSALQSSIHILDNISGLEIRGTSDPFHLPLLDQVVQSVPKCSADFLAQVIHPPMVLCTYLFFSLPVLLYTSLTYLFY